METLPHLYQVLYLGQKEALSHELRGQGVGVGNEDCTSQKNPRWQNLTLLSGPRSTEGVCFNSWKGGVRG